MYMPKILFLRLCAQGLQFQASVLRSSPRASVLRSSPRASVLRSSPRASVLRSSPRASVLRSSPRASVLRSSPQASVLRSSPRASVLRSSPQASVLLMFFISSQSAELLEVFIVSLVNVSMVGASVGSPSSATISVQANDHPYGLFVFTPSYRPLLVAEDSGRVQVVVTREFGSLGQVMVDVWVVPSAEVRTSTLLNTQVNIEDIIMNR